MEFVALGIGQLDLEEAHQTLKEKLKIDLLPHSQDGFEPFYKGFASPPYEEFKIELEKNWNVVEEFINGKIEVDEFHISSSSPHHATILTIYGNDIGKDLARTIKRTCFPDAEEVILDSHGRSSIKNVFSDS